MHYDNTEVSRVQATSKHIEFELQQFMDLLKQWMCCDQANQDNHYMYYKLIDWLNVLQHKVNDLELSVAELELLERIYECGYVGDC